MAHDPRNLIDTAILTGGYDTFIDALQKSKVSTSLQEDGPYTLFAPNQSAFQEFEQELAKRNSSLISLFSNEDETRKLVNRHIIPGRVDHEEIINMAGGKIETIDGNFLKIKMSDNKLFIEDAEVLRTDIEASNGFIHEINKVLAPDDLQF